MSNTTRKPKKKRIRGFGGILAKQLEPLNTNEYFQKNFKEKNTKLLLNANDGKFAALITLKDGNISIESVPNTPKKGLKKKLLGWKGKLETDTGTFLNLAIGTIGLGAIIKGVFKRKIKIRGPLKLLILLKMFNILSYDDKKAKEGTN